VTDSEITLDADGLYRAHVQQVGRWAARLGGPALDLEDTVHEVFAIACTRLATFRGDSTLATWLFGITDKVVRHRRRKERWWRWLSGSADETAGHLSADGPDPLRAAEQTETAKSVYRVLDQLAEGDRRILILFELEELAGDEVGELLRIKPANARLRLHRARTRFQKVYEREFRGDNAGVAETEVTSERYNHVSR
jgi:RNA polymerase sigma-70 factor (ECF subfamily)